MPVAAPPDPVLSSGHNVHTAASKGRIEDWEDHCLCRSILFFTAFLQARSLPQSQQLVKKIILIFN